MALGVLRVWALLTALSPLAARVQAQDTTSVKTVRDSVSLRFVNTDLRSVIQALGRYLSRPVMVAGLPELRVSLETPQPVSRGEVEPLLRGLVEAQGLEFVQDTSFIRIAPKPQAPPSQPVARRDSGATGPVQLFVVRLKHARASDVASTVNLLFGGSGSFSGQSTLSGGTLSDELRRNVVPPQAASPAPGAGPAAASSPANLSGPVTIVPDQLTNSLLVRSSREDFEVLTQAVEQLDIRPLQVLIEVLIVEARRDRNFSLGSDLLLPPNSIGGDQTVSGTLTGGGLGDLVIKLMNLGKANIDAVLRTAQSKGDVDIVSRPILLASNNTEARFLVGTQRPFVQVSRSLPTDSPSRDQVVQYRDVGTKLTVLPTINQDGYVSLALQQEVNAATNETQFDAPVISTREAATQVLVRDGQTIVLGGLRDHQRDNVQSGIPLLSGLPLVGGVFGSTSRHRTETELYIFLTPRIIRTDEEADQVTAPRLGKLVP